MPCPEKLSDFSLPNGLTVTAVEPINHYRVEYRGIDDTSFRLDYRAPPLLFRRRPPQSNYPPQRVPDPDNGSRLDIRKQQGGISPMAPHRLAPVLQSLPRSEEHTSELQSLMRISYAAFCLKTKKTFVDLSFKHNQSYIKQE